METIFLVLMILSQLCYATLSTSDRKAWKVQAWMGLEPW